jgi:sulfatase maturation enzyme AslB (radical SAM superfamily)
LEFLEHIDEIYINGNFGDIVMNPEAIDIIRYFKQHDIEIVISTNGGARKKDFWEDLAVLDCKVLFCLDGLSDTHSIYRQDTVFETVLNNAKTFIAKGGRAVWKWIPFDHNKHQIEEARSKAKALGFSEFQFDDQGRNTGIVVNKRGEVVNIIGNPIKTDFKELLESKKNNEILLEDISSTINRNIDCKVKKGKSIYVTSTGEVYPCCWTGFYPRTYGHGQYYQVVNKQLNEIIKPNNALERPLEECIEWFNDIEKSWSIDKFEDGRLVVCNDYCGH